MTSNWSSRFARPVPLIIAVLSAHGCAAWQGRTAPDPTPPSAQVTFGTDAASSRIAVRRSNQRPSVTTVVREGDPSPALAAAVLTDGNSVASAALAAVAESRLQAAGWLADSRADADGYRVRVLVQAPATAAAAVSDLRKALEAPIAVGQPELAAVSKRVNALRHHSLDSAALVPVIRCTGQLAAVPSTTFIDSSKAADVQQLERWRAEAHSATRVSIGAVGPEDFTEQVAQAIQDGPTWPSGNVPIDAWPDADTVGAYALPGSSRATPTLTIAARVRDPFAVTRISERAFSGSSALVTRLTETTSWQVTRVAATVRPRGACIAVSLRRESDAITDDLENEAARVAALVAHEVETQLAEVRADGSVAGRQVLGAADPRDAAGLAAWWSHVSLLEAGEDRLAVALGRAPPRVEPNEGPAVLDRRVADLGRKFSAGFTKAQAAWATPVVEMRTRVEAGQGELWVLAATSCGTRVDAIHDAGLTALAAVSASRTSGRSDDVFVEPWITQQGVGILAHGSRQLNEGSHALASRIADAATRALVRRRIPDLPIQESRAALLGLLEQPGGPHSSAFGKLAQMLAPQHPSWLAPFGLPDALVEAGPQTVNLRWQSIGDGPIRVAVIANDDQAQADAAVRAADRWLVSRSDHARKCPPSSPISLPADAPRDVTLYRPKTGSHALLGYSVANLDRAGSTMLELLVEALQGDDGWMTRAFSSFSPPVSTRARITGGDRLAALVVELRPRGGGVEPSITQARAVFDRLARGAATKADLERAQRKLAVRYLEQSTDPRQRIATLWLDRPPPGDITLPAWNAFLSRSFAPSSMVVVRVEPASAQP